MIIKTGKINKSRGNISLTIGKEDVKKHNLEEGDFVILTPEEYEELKTSSEIEVSTLEVVPDDEAVVKLEYDLKEAKSKEKILFSKVEELENINLELTTKLSQLEKANYIGIFICKFFHGRKNELQRNKRNIGRYYTDGTGRFLR